MASVRREKKFRDKYLNDLAREMRDVEEAIEDGKGDLSETENEAYYSLLERKQRNAYRYFDAMDNHTVIVNGKKHNMDKVSYEAFQKSYEHDLLCQYNKLAADLNELKQQKENSPRIQVNGSTPYIAKINRVEKDMARLKAKMRDALELSKHREAFFESKSVLGNAKRIVSEFKDSLPGRKLQDWRYEWMYRRSNLLGNVGVLVSQIKKDTDELKNHSAQKSFEQLKKESELLIEKKQDLLKLLKEVNKCDMLAKRHEPTEGQLKILNREESIAHKSLSKLLDQICIACGDESLESIIDAYQQSINEEMADFAKKYDNFGNSRKTWEEKVQPGLSSRKQDYEKSAEKTSDDLAM